MKSRFTPLVAALLLAGAAPFAYSQAAAPAVAAPASYADAPMASVSRSDDLANVIAQALIADASLKDSKITVQPEEDGAILLTGVTANNAQRQKAVEIATSHAGAGKVTNALTSGELVISTTPAITAATGSQDTVTASQETATASQDTATASQAAATAPRDTLAVPSDFVAAPEPAIAAGVPPAEAVPQSTQGTAAPKN